jgi:hypothetical protein
MQWEAESNDGNKMNWYRSSKLEKQLPKKENIWLSHPEYTGKSFFIRVGDSANSGKSH